MVYCKVKEQAEGYAVYSIGKRIDDMTGEIVFFKDEREPELREQAEHHPIRLKDIIRLYAKYRAEFANGEFREKLAIEIG